MESIVGRIAIPPELSSALLLLSISQSVLCSREPPTESENVPRVATSLLAAAVKKLFGLVCWVVPGVRVASCTKSRPFNGRSATSSDVITWPSVGFVVSTATSVAVTSTVWLTDAGFSVKSISRCSSTCRRMSFCSVVWNPCDSTRMV